MQLPISSKIDLCSTIQLRFYPTFLKPTLRASFEIEHALSSDRLENLRRMSFRMNRRKSTLHLKQSIIFFSHSVPNTGCSSKISANFCIRISLVESTLKYQNRIPLSGPHIPLKESMLCYQTNSMFGNIIFGKEIREVLCDYLCNFIYTQMLCPCKNYFCENIYLEISVKVTVAYPFLDEILNMWTQP